MSIESLLMYALAADLIIGGSAQAMPDVTTLIDHAP
jgi:hypothetical protein